MLRNQLALLNAWCESHRFHILLTLVTACMLVVVELQRPYFFLNGDNLQQFLPYYVHNFRALLAGDFPLFNFHQYLGTPVLSGIQSGAFYLPNYLAVFLSKVVFGDYYQTIELIAAFHLILASLTFFSLMRHFNLDNWSCCFGALAWTFCGFVFINGTVLIMLLCYAAYLPLLLRYSLLLSNDFKLRTFTILAMLRAVVIFIGSPPYIIYMFTFEILTATLVYLATRPGCPNGHDNTVSSSRTIFRQFWLFQARQLTCYLAAFVIAAPILLPALNQMKLSATRSVPLSWQQYSSFNYTLVEWLNGLFTPIPDAHQIYTGFGLNFLSHVGWLTIIFASLSVISIWRDDSSRKLLWIFISLALFAFLWSNNTFITKFFYHLPLYNRQRWPFKIGFFTSFYIIVISSFAFDYVVRAIRRHRPRHQGLVSASVVFIVALHVANFFHTNLVSPQLSLVIRRLKPPIYNEPLSEDLCRGRIISLVRSNTGDDVLFHYGDNYDNTRLLGFNYATLFGLYHFAGYETLVSDKNLKNALMLNNSAYLFVEDVFDPKKEDLDYFRKWGVRWYVIAKDVAFGAPGLLQKYATDDHRTILYDPEAKPLVYWLDDDKRGGIRYRFTTNSITVATQTNSAGQININVLYNPFFKGTINGMPVKIEESSTSQMIVSVPSGRHEINIVFTDPYFYNGLYLSFGFLALVSGVWGVRRLKRHSGEPENIENAGMS